MPYYVIYDVAKKILKYGQSSRLSWGIKVKTGEKILEVPFLENKMDVNYRVDNQGFELKKKL